MKYTTKRIYDPLSGRLVPSDDPALDTTIVQQKLENSQSLKTVLANTNTTQYSQLFNALYDATLVTDINGTITEANIRVENVLGYSVSELLGYNIMQLIAGGNEELLIKVRNQVLSRSFIQLECCCRNKIGQQFPATVIANALGAEQQPRLCFFIRNAVAKKRIELELKAAQDMAIEAEKIQARIDIVSTIIHNINNPLQIISCMSEMDHNPEYKKQIDVIISVLDQLNQNKLLEEIIDEDSQSLYEINIPRALAPIDMDRFLVVDDETVVRELFVLALQTEFPDKQIDQASDGVSAVDLFTSHQHGLILMDSNMPRLSGEGSFLRIREVCQSKGLMEPVCIFCTGFQINDVIAGIIGDGGKHTTIKKPVSISVLVNTVKSALARCGGVKTP